MSGKSDGMWMTYCLLCGDRSDGDIAIEDVFDWNRDHGDEVHPDVEWSKQQYDLVRDGQDHVLTMQSVGGFTVGDTVQLEDSEARAAYPERADVPQVISGFTIYGYQGIVAEYESGQVDYLDHIELVN